VSIAQTQPNAVEQTFQSVPSSLPHNFQLTEYEPAWFASTEIPPEIGEALWRQYGSQIAVDFPSPKTGGQWRLTSQGWVGHIPLSPQFHLTLQPKVTLNNLFRMLEYAYDLDSLKWLEGLVECQSLREFYERLAHILARRVADRGREGLYRAYVPETAQLPYVRGRLDPRPAMASPGQVKLHCHFQEHTIDVEENRILAWTLFIIARSGLCSERVLPAVRRAYRLLQGGVRLQPYQAQACAGRHYNRLNDDYGPMHALCHFFLEHSGPGHQAGNWAMLPFLVDMARLYERFVTEWLKANLPGNLRVKAQEKIDIDSSGALYFKADLIIYDTTSGEARYVLDTKYKLSAQPSPEDVAQVTAYAHFKDCRQAILIYPASLQESLDTQRGDIHVRSLTFALTGDLEQAGHQFLQQLLA
jgi:5-methylcytosine-specific restriction enzyme subunit McrC